MVIAGHAAVARLLSVEEGIAHGEIAQVGPALVEVDLGKLIQAPRGLGDGLEDRVGDVVLAGGPGNVRPDLGDGFALFNHGEKRPSPCLRPKTGRWFTSLSKGRRSLKGRAPSWP